MRDGTRHGAFSNHWVQRLRRWCVGGGPEQVHAGRGLIKIWGLDPKDTGEPLWSSEAGSDVVRVVFSVGEAGSQKTS